MQESQGNRANPETKQIKHAEVPSGYQKDDPRSDGGLSVCGGQRAVEGAEDNPLGGPT